MTVPDAGRQNDSVENSGSEQAMQNPKVEKSTAVRNLHAMPCQMTRQEAH